MPSIDRRKLARDLYLAFEHAHTSTHFHAKLFRLMHKADPHNLDRLREGFPVEVAMYREWRMCPTEAEFYVKRYNIGPIIHGEEKRVFERRFGTMAAKGTP